MDCDDVAWRTACGTWIVVKDASDIVVATFKYVQDAAKYVQDELIDAQDNQHYDMMPGESLTHFTIEAKYLPDLGKTLAK